MEIKIVHFEQKYLGDFYPLAGLVHPKEKGLEARMKWFTFGNPLYADNAKLPGLAIVFQEKEVIGQFLMAPFEFYLHGKKYRGHFGYDFFVKEEYRSRGAGALLFVQGVRMFGPFIGVGLTQVVEKISKAAGIQVIGQIRKFIWTSNPLTLGTKLLKNKLVGGSDKISDDGAEGRFPETIELSGLKLVKISHVSQGLGPSFSSETLEPARTKEFLTWRFADSPWKYHMYGQASGSSDVFLVIRQAYYQGMRLLLIVDYRFEKENYQQLGTILQAAKTIAREARLDGVVMASTCGVMDEALQRERFVGAGRPSSVIGYLPKADFPLPVHSIGLTMADADLDFSFGEGP
ncbi:MAG: hypothetical protein JNN05_07395 [Candidatus Omnitrophica bacterium]|nr:hypothetical protein [Candidatus Omnitrophota bacterium]